MGVDPRPYTLRQLLWMQTGRQRHDGLLVANLKQTMYATNGTHSTIEKLHPFGRDPDEERVSMKPSEYWKRHGGKKRRHPRR